MLGMKDAATSDSIRSSIGTALHSRFDPGAANGLDIDFRFQFDSGQSDIFRIRAGRFYVIEQTPELTIFVASEMLLLELIAGAASPIDAFMAGRLSSSGYLMRVFGILRSFQST